MEKLFDKEIPMKRILTRDVTPEECPWLNETIKRGTTVSDSGKAVTKEDGKTPFFEIPREALGL